LDDAQGSVIQRRNPEFKHSDFFSKLNFEKNWVSFLQGKRPQSWTIDAVPTNWKFRILCLALLTLTISVVVFEIKSWPLKADLAAPLLDSEYPVVKAEELPKLAQVEASVPSAAGVSIVIENQTSKRLEVCAYNAYRHYFRTDISQPDWSQLKPIDAASSEPLVLKNAKSGIFLFYVRDAYSRFMFVGRFDLTEINEGSLVVTIDNGSYVATPIAH
jgi:hypothetical protein